MMIADIIMVTVAAVVIIIIIYLVRNGHVKRMQDERLSKLIMEWIPGERRKKRTSKKNVDGSCTSSHENKTFRRRSVAKQKGMVFGFRKTATAVTRPER